MKNNSLFRNPRSLRTSTLLSLACLFAVLAPRTETLADRPFQRMRRNINSIRPGWIIPLPNDPRPPVSPPGNPTKAREPLNRDKATSKKSQKAKDKRSEAKPKQTDKADKERAVPEPTPELADTERFSDEVATPESFAPPELPEAPEEFGAKAVKDDENVVLVEIDPGGAAAAAGLQVNDVIKAVGGVEIAHVESLEGMTEVLNNGAIVEFELVRDGKEFKKDVQFGTYQASEFPQEADEPSATLDLDSAQPLPTTSIEETTQTKAKEIKTRIQSVLSPSVENATSPSAELAPQKLLELTETPSLPTKTGSLDHSVEDLLDLDVAPN